MAFLSSLNISGSALTAQRYRMDLITQNLANVFVSCRNLTDRSIICKPVSTLSKFLVTRCVCL